MIRIAIVLSLLLLAHGCTQTAATNPPTTRPATLTPGDHRLGLDVDGLHRTCLVHVPPGYAPNEPTPVVLVFHGVSGTGEMMVDACGLSRKADAAGFVVVYPDAADSGCAMVYWNAGSRPSSVNDVKFVGKLLDDLATVVNVDPKRVYATGLSNGAFMCYRLAAELSDRIAAIAPVAGTSALDHPRPSRPVPVIHFHGTADTMVPFDGPTYGGRTDIKFTSVDDTVRTWAKLDGCPDEPTVTTLPDTANDGTTVTQKVFGPGRDGSEVVLAVIENGGHRWPGRLPAVDLLGKSTANISADDVMWDFFQKHPMK